jgi:hypothetical protein
LAKRGFGAIKKKSDNSNASNGKALVVPNTIFFDDKLAILEAIVQYLKEVKKLNYKEIGTVLERDQRNIWTVYSRVKKKQTKPVSERPSLFIPVSILKDRSLSGFEVIVEYLKEQEKLSFHEIGSLLHRDERNIWTVYHRAKIKRGNK